MDLRKLTRWAISYGRSQGLSIELAEDMAQNWLINKVIKKTGQSINHAYVDMMRSEYGRGDHFKKNSYLELDEQHHGTYNLPEIYVTDLSSARLKKRLGRVHFRCLQLMAKETHWRERMKKMKTNDFTLFHMQKKIREEINAILMTDFSVHRRSFNGKKNCASELISPIKH